MTKIIRITPNGQVDELDGNDLVLTATLALGGVDTFSCIMPHGAPPEYPHWDGVLVGCVAEFGRRDGAVVNPKAWALYGRSPLVGDVYLAADVEDDDSLPEWHRPDLPPEFIAALRTDFVQPPVMRVDAMRDIATNAGHLWPEP